jgi:hypothetical protein
VLVATRGLFFYYTVIRQDLVGKLILTDVDAFPQPPNIKAIASAGIEGVESVVVVRVPQASTILNWWGLVDILTERTFPCFAGRVTVGARDSEPRWWVFGGVGDDEIRRLDWFVIFFFLWYRGLYESTGQDFSGVVEYVQYRPALLPFKTSAITLWWGSWEGCPALPDVVARESVRLCTTFLFRDGVRIVAQRALLGGLRYTQRALS